MPCVSVILDLTHPHLLVRGAAPEPYEAATSVGQAWRAQAGIRLNAEGTGRSRATRAYAEQKAGLQRPREQHTASGAELLGVICLHSTAAAHKGTQGG
jgi:hypothetical protein